MIYGVLFKHVNEYHRDKPGVCPICVEQPYGDPNYVSQNLSAHINLRHFTETQSNTYNDSEEDYILKLVMEESLKQS